MSKVKGRVTKGMRFRSAFADTNALWETKQSRGKGVWICEIVNEPIEINGTMYPGDYAGQQQPFTREQILAAVVRETMFDGLRDAHDDFYASLTPGQIVHYRNSTRDYVRCEVVEHEGENKLLPIALVGNWNRPAIRQPDGSIYYDYNAAKVLRVPFGNSDNVYPVFTPSYSCIYESNPRDLDPRKLDPVDLSVPPLTETEKVEAGKWQKVNEIKKFLQGNERNPQRILDILEEMMEQTPESYFKLFVSLTGTPV